VTIAALIVIGATVAIGATLAARSGWLTGQPAPPPVVSDFDLYAPQLGFRPHSDRAVLVAEDADVSLYATTNDEGSYCLVASAPWKRPETLPDGGTCIPSAHAAAPLIAGLVGVSSKGETTTYLIAGRTAHASASTIWFTDPGGEPITRPVGASGFFIAKLTPDTRPCANGDWKPTFTVIGAGGEEVARATVTLGTAGSPGACGFAAPHPG
jgi:hypothetical protein